MHARTLTTVTAAVVALILVSPPVLSQAPAQRAEGTLLLMTGSAAVEIDNDEALAQFFFETQEADLPRAQSIVNQRVAEGVAQVKRADPKALVETAGYTTYPVYQPGTQRKLIGWRVRQGVSLRTGDLAALPRAVAAAQQHLALAGIDFRLSRAARTRVEAELIEQAIANLNDKVAAAARALKVAPERVRLEELNFGVTPPPIPRMRSEMMASAAPPVEEPQFDAGRSLQQLTVTGKARLLPP
jgi:predicted secreted protein